MTFTKLGRDVQTQQVVQVGFDERKSHIDIMGGTGTGKTTLLINIALQDIHQERAGAFFDPHGGAIRAILKRAKKTDKLFWLDPNEENFPAMNLLYCSDISDSQQVDASVSFALRIFKRLWKINEDTPNLEIILKCCFITLIYNKKTLDFLPDLIKDANLRNQMIAKIPTAHRFAKWFWEDDFNKWPPTEKTRRTESTLNKVLAFLTNSTVAKIVSKEGLVDFTSALKNGHFFLFRMNPKRTGKKGGIEEDGVRYVGSILMALFVDTAMRRDELKRDFFSLILDEFHRFATDEFQFILAELRQYGVAVTLAYQFKGQLDLSLIGAVEQTAIKVVFRVNKKEAEDSAPLFADDSPVSEMRREPISSPAVQPIQELLGARGIQGNPAIDFFTRKRLMIFNNAIKESHQEQIGASRAGPRFRNVPLSELERLRYELDEIFCEVMVEKNPYKNIPAEMFLTFEKYAADLSIPHIAYIIGGDAFDPLSRHLDWIRIYGKSSGYRDLDVLLHQQARTTHMVRGEKSKAYISWGGLFTSTEEFTKIKLQEIYAACYRIYITNGILIDSQEMDMQTREKIKNEKEYLLMEEAKDDRYWIKYFNSKIPNWKQRTIKKNGRYLSKEEDQKSLMLDVLTKLEWLVLFVYYPIFFFILIQIGSYLHMNEGYATIALDIIAGIVSLYLSGFAFVLIPKIPIAILESKQAEKQAKISKLRSLLHMRDEHNEVLEHYRSDIKYLEESIEQNQQKGQELVEKAKTVLKEEMLVLEARVLELRGFMQALALEPIEAISKWVEKPSLRENPQFTITDRVKELLNLETGVAWCRIIDQKAPEGQKNKRLKIRLLDPKEIVKPDQDETPYEQRFATIVQKTQAKYGVKEIREVPQEPPKVEPVPSHPQPTSKPTSRLSRKVEVADNQVKHCPACAHQLKSTAKFCENCGYNLKVEQNSSNVQTTDKTDHPRKRSYPVSEE